VNLIRQILALIAVIAVPIAAYSMFAPAKDGFCFAGGPRPTRSRVPPPPPTSAPKSPAMRPGTGLRMWLVDSPEIADFVLVGDFSAAESMACRSATPVQTVAVDSGSV
jgi:hypothetical protein